MPIPSVYPFRKLEKLLKDRSIVWEPDKGKGGHGSFVGPDKSGKIQAYPLGRTQAKEVTREYLKGLCRRFELNPDSLFG